MNVNNENLNPTSSNINWALVDSLKMSDAPDDDSPELTDADLKQLKSLSSLLNKPVTKIVRFKQRGIQIRQQLAQMRQM